MVCAMDTFKWVAEWILAMDKADRNMLTLHTAGLANVQVTEIAIKLISYLQMPGFLWNQFGMIMSFLQQRTNE